MSTDGAATGEPGARDTGTGYARRRGQARTTVAWTAMARSEVDRHGGTVPRPLDGGRTRPLAWVRRRAAPVHPAPGDRS